MTKVLRVKDINYVRFNPRYPRFTHPEEEQVAIQEMVASIRSLGLLNLPTVNRTSSGYTVIQGRCRLDALRLLADEDPQRWEYVECTVVDNLSDEQMACMYLAENMTRRKLPGVVIGEYLVEIKRYLGMGFTEADVLACLSITPARMKEYMRLTCLPGSVQRAEREGKISTSHALLLTTQLPRRLQPGEDYDLDPAIEERLDALVSKIAADSLTVRQLRDILVSGAPVTAECSELAESEATTAEDPSKSKPVFTPSGAASDRLKALFGDAATVVGKQLKSGDIGKGYLKLGFSNEQELNALLDKVTVLSSLQKEYPEIAARFESVDVAPETTDTAIAPGGTTPEPFSNDETAFGDASRGGAVSADISESFISVPALTDTQSNAIFVPEPTTLDSVASVPVTKPVVREMTKLASEIKMTPKSLEPLPDSLTDPSLPWVERRSEAFPWFTNAEATAYREEIRAHMRANPSPPPVDQFVESVSKEPLEMPENIMILPGDVPRPDMYHPLRAANDADLKDFKVLIRRRDCYMIAEYPIEGSDKVRRVYSLGYLSIRRLMVSLTCGRDWAPHGAERLAKERALAEENVRLDLKYPHMYEPVGELIEMTIGSSTVSYVETADYIERIKNRKLSMVYEEQIHVDGYLLPKNIRIRRYKGGGEVLTVRCHRDWEPEGDEQMRARRKALERMHEYSNKETEEIQARLKRERLEKAEADRIAAEKAAVEREAAHIRITERRRKYAEEKAAAEEMRRAEADAEGKTAD
ncbi:hypothetical protein FACS1894208_00310 [Clostridia bacterium]|nr:hypothetical protein FACS1894208_00310 [Clostridia bacterium]